MRFISTTMPVSLLLVVLAGPVHTDGIPGSVTMTQDQAQARQFGIFFGGTASQYDLCVRKGFFAQGSQSAEEIAKAYLVKMPVLNKGQDLSAYVQDGWDMMKKEISEDESFYTQEKCTGVGKQWAKMMAMMRAK